MSYLRMYGLLIRASIRSRMQYKLNFWMSSLLAAVVSAMDFLLISLILWKFGTIQSWSLYEIGYLYATILLAKSIYRTFASDVHHLEKYLLSGDLDQLLTRPLPLLLGLMTQNVRLMPGEMIQGVLILTLCLRELLLTGQVTWTAIPLTLLIVLTGSVLLFAIGLGTATVGFWITRVSDLQNLTEDAARTAAQYPLEIYPRWLQSILLTLIPVGIANYVPALFVLRGAFDWWLLPGTMLFTALFAWGMLRFWQYGLTRYQSTGT